MNVAEVLAEIKANQEPPTLAEAAQTKTLPASIPEANAVHGAAVKSAVETNLSETEQRLATCTNETERRALLDAQSNYLAQLAESLALTGDFQTASEMHPNADSRRFYQIRAAALARLGETCTCQQTISQPRFGAKAARTTAQPTEKRQIEQVWLAKQNRTVAFLECSACEQISAVLL